MLEFEHIVQVNDFENPAVTPLNRRQLWEGLLFRARRPGQFTDALECTLDEVEETGFIRYLKAGDTVFRDKVVLFAPDEIHTQTTGNPEQTVQQPYAESITRIEEPAPGHLFVRFTYRRDTDKDQQSVNIDEHLKSAYLHNDRDAVAMIREFARLGLLSAPGSGTDDASIFPPDSHDG